MLVIKNGAPVILRINEKLFVICDEPVRDEDGTVLPVSHCGQLIDVTDKPIKVTDSCGCSSNHISTWVGRTG